MLIETGKKVIEKEIEALKGLKLNNEFPKACRAILECTGRIIVMGMGKSSLIGRKIAATLASTGTPSFFVHPGEAAHGDLGAICEDDVIIMLSHSGETQEILLARRFLNNQIISITGNPASTLANLANININVAVKSEACPLNKAPTCSTTAALVMGDALAMTIMQMRGFTEKDFLNSHPGGSLGRNNGNNVHI